jgi:cytochrome c553
MNRVTIISTTAIVAFAATIGAGDTLAAGNAERGRRVTEKWCVLCHAVAGARRPTAPAFAAIVRRDGLDEAYLRQFLKDDHFPMTTYRLFDQEKEDVLTYFQSLRKRP